MEYKGICGEDQEFFIKNGSSPPENPFFRQPAGPSGIGTITLND
jgi:hypothetical protein